MNLKSILGGHYLIEITCADPAFFLNTTNSNGVVLSDLMHCDRLRIHATIRRDSYTIVARIAERYGASVRILRRSGAYWLAAAWVRRPLIPILCCFMLAAACYVPSKVLFVSVEGNHSIPTNLILDAAEECGIRFGASRRLVRSEVMKNKLLEKIPQLQWAGINTNGCVATIRVREKTEYREGEQYSNQVCSIVAARDGVIRSCVVRKGNPLCTVGQAVKAGETLVSGYTDCGLVTVATQADAEIQALTFREIHAVSPIAASVRAAINEEKTVYSLRIGKKLIKFYKDSGILDTTCAKIYSEECLQLPGGFYLPVAIIKERFLFYDNATPVTPTTDGNDWLTAFAQDHLKKAMIAGEIVSSETDISSTEDACYLSGKYACIEMIGQVKPEQTTLKDESYD